MQVFVKRSDLPTEPVPVFAFYEDSPRVADDLHGPDMALLSLPVEKVDRSVTPPVLVSDFRLTKMPQMVNDQANRRIDVAFPDYMQRNANADINNSTVLYGTNVASWPQDAKDRKAEGDRGWTYVSQVRSTSDALSTNTGLIDPTDDVHWPTEITPVYIPPVTP